MKSLVGALLRVPELNIPTIGGGWEIHRFPAGDVGLRKDASEIADRHFAICGYPKTTYGMLPHGVPDSDSPRIMGIGAAQSMSEIADADCPRR